MELLQVSQGNAKLKNILSISLPAGYTCPGARDCLARAHRLTGRITDGDQMEFRCFSTSQEAMYPSVRNARWANFALIQKALRIGVEECRNLLIASIGTACRENHVAVRAHIAGDFFSSDYALAWMGAARALPNLQFYAYTKSVSILAELHWAKQIPPNFTWIASMGGKEDVRARLEEWRTAWVVGSEEEAKAVNLPIDHDETLARNPKVRRFALLVHGTQPSGSAYAEAWQKIRSEGGGYGRRRELHMV